jgi:hypothetical protein
MTLEGAQRPAPYQHLEDRVFEAMGLGQERRTASSPKKQESSSKYKVLQIGFVSIGVDG